MPIILLYGTWYTAVACVVLMVSPDVVDIISEYFVVYFVFVYIFGSHVRTERFFFII